MNGKLRAKTMRVNGYGDVLENQTLCRHILTRLRILTPYLLHSQVGYERGAQRCRVS